MATSIELIDNTPALKTLLDSLKECPKAPPSLYVDLEGNNLSRHGTLSLVTMFIEPQNKVYLIDVTTLGQAAFKTAGSTRWTLKDILESDKITKVFFDIRNDSDALFALHGIQVAGIEDLQLWELASRSFKKNYINGLAKCIERDASINYVAKLKWIKDKEIGRKLFAPEKGGSYAVFDERPLSSEIQTYCAQDVTLMPNLRRVYHSRLCDAWLEKIEEETKKRIRLSQEVTFNGKGLHMTDAPFQWRHWDPTYTERHTRVLLDGCSQSLATPSPTTSDEETSARLSSMFGAMGLENVDRTSHRIAIGEVDSDAEDE